MWAGAVGLRSQWGVACMLGDGTMDTEQNTEQKEIERRGLGFWSAASSQ